MPPKIRPAAPPTQPPGPTGATLDYYDSADVAIGANYRLPAGDSQLTDDELDAALGIDAAWLDDLAATGGNMDPVALLNRTPTSDDPRPYLVKHGGARRVRGCYRAGLKLYAYVTGDEGDGHAEDLARLVNQWRENHQRKPTDAAADARAIQGMLDLGMTDAAVCKTLRLKGGKDTVAAARKVARSKAAAAVAAAHPLDLAKTAQIADFEDTDDGEAVTRLEETLDTDPDQFAHVAQQLRDTAAERAQRRQVIADLKAAAVPVIEEQNDTWQRSLLHLRDADGERITAEQHQSCPGHAAYADSTQICRDGKWQREWKPVFICTDPDGNGHTSYISRVHGSADQTPAERQAELDEKRRTRAGNTEWRSATTVRREHITQQIAPLAQLPKEWDVPGYRLSVLSSDGYNLRYAMERGHEQACAWLGVKEDTNGSRRDGLRKLASEATPARRAVIELVLFLGAAEKFTASADTWNSADYGYRNPLTAAAGYLRFLETTGYTLSPIEAHLAHGKRGKYKPEALRGTRTGPPSTRAENES